MSQRTAFVKSDIDQSLVEAGNGTAVHFVVLSVAAVHLDNRGLVTVGVGIRAGTTIVDNVYTESAPLGAGARPRRSHGASCRSCLTPR